MKPPCAAESIFSSRTVIPATIGVITGTLYDYACGRITDLLSVIEERDRDAAGRTAPAEGLYLNRVFYNDEERIAAQNEDFYG
jgi:tRNA U38,U39,U40 pseudouridine synthase TruA